jgi:hypothetical protein
MMLMSVRGDFSLHGHCRMAVMTGVMAMVMLMVLFVLSMHVVGFMLMHFTYLFFLGFLRRIF